MMGVSGRQSRNVGGDPLAPMEVAPIMGMPAAGPWMGFRRLPAPDAGSREGCVTPSCDVHSAFRHRFRQK